jgi:hypothetical protein
MPYCNRCGNPVQDEDKFCTKCGTRQSASGSAIEPTTGVTNSSQKSNPLDMSLLELSSSQFKNCISANDDDTPFAQARGLMAKPQGAGYAEATRVIAESIIRCQRKDRLCELLGAIFLNRKDPRAIGWYMQSLVLGSSSWVPYLIVSTAARAVQADRLAWRCLNACDVLDTRMLRMDALQAKVSALAQSAEAALIMASLENFEQVMDTFLPGADEIPHDDRERSTFLAAHSISSQDDYVHHMAARLQTVPVAHSTRPDPRLHPPLLPWQAEFGMLGLLITQNRPLWKKTPRIKCESCRADFDVRESDWSSVVAHGQLLSLSSLQECPFCGGRNVALLNPPVSK